MNDLIDSINPRGKVAQNKDLLNNIKSMFYVNYEHAQHVGHFLYNIVFLRAIFTVIAPPMVLAMKLCMALRLCDTCFYQLLKFQVLFKFYRPLVMCDQAPFLMS